MAAKQTAGKPIRIFKKTSIGNSPLSRPLNKHKRRNTKPYRGQGK